MSSQPKKQQQRKKKISVGEQRRRARRRDRRVVQREKAALNSKISMISEQVTKKVDETMVMDVIRMWLKPDQFSSRLCDSYPTPTALISSTSTIPIYANLNAGPDSGKFSILFNPKLGSIVDPSQYQLAIVDTENGWTPSSYSYIDYVGGRDIRLDPNIAALTYPSIGILKHDAASSLTHAAAFGLSLPNVGTGFFGMPYLLNSPSVTGFYVSDFLLSQFPFLGEYPQVFNTINLWSLPAGSYSLNLTMLSEGNLLTNPVVGVYAGLVESASSYTHTSTYLWQAASFADGTSNSQTYDGNTATYLSSVTNLTGVVHNASNFNIAGWEFVLNVPPGKKYNLVTLGIAGVIADPHAAPCSGPLRLEILLNPTINSQSVVTNGGTIDYYRPVACSMLLTNTQPNLYAGGYVVAGQLPQSAMQTYFSDNLQDFSNLKTNFPNCLHCGSFVKGAYVWWSPNQSDQYQVRSIADNLAFQQDGLVIAGQVSSTTGLTGYVQVAELTVNFKIEATRLKTIFDVTTCIGDTQKIDAAMNSVAEMIHGCENPSHLKNIAKEFYKAGKYVYNKARPALPYVTPFVAKLLMNYF